MANYDNNQPGEYERAINANLVRELREASSDYEDRVDLILARVICYRLPHVDLSIQLRRAMIVEFGAEPLDEELTHLVECAESARSVFEETLPGQ